MSDGTACSRHRLLEPRCNDCHAKHDDRPNRTPGHAWFCDCSQCEQDGNESQWHRMLEPHSCVRLNGELWLPERAALSPWKREAYAHLYGGDPS